MNLETQVTSLEMSKELKEVGFKLDTCFDWVNDTRTSVQVPQQFRAWVEQDATSIYSYDPLFIITPAYTFQQLWTVLLGAQERSGGEINMYWASQLRKAEVLPDTAAKAILWCIENDYIEVSK